MEMRSLGLVLLPDCDVGGVKGFTCLRQVSAPGTVECSDHLAHQVAHHGVGIFVLNCLRQMEIDPEHLGAFGVSGYGVVHHRLDFGQYLHVASEALGLAGVDWVSFVGLLVGDFSSALLIC